MCTNAVVINACTINHHFFTCPIMHIHSNILGKFCKCERDNRIYANVASIKALLMSLN